MRKLQSMVLATAVISMGTGCSEQQAVSIVDVVTQAKLSGRQGAANALAVSTFTSQLTLYCLATALSQAASIDLQGDDLPPIGSFGDPTTTMTYAVDPEHGTGKVSGQRSGKDVIDLSFTFKRTSGNAGMAYEVTETTGHVEGFNMFFPRLTFLYTAVTGGDFQPIKNAQCECSRCSS